MREVASFLLLAAAACGTGDNVVVGGIGGSNITPIIQFDNIRSVINGRARLFDASGNDTGIFSQVVIISDQPQLCDRLAENRDYFRVPPETYLAMILFLPPTNHLGTFLLGRPGDEGTTGEIIGVKDTGTPVPPFTTTKPLAPFPALDRSGYIALRDWSESPGGEAVGSFNFAFAPPAALNVDVPNGFQFYGKFKSTVCPTLDGTLLP